MTPLKAIRAVCFDWGGTLMSEQGPQELPMALWPEVRVLDGARECLALLAGRVTLAIATNATVSTHPQIVQALARVGLDGFVSAVFCYTDLGVRKAQPAFWQVVSAQLGVPLDRIAMIGDSLEQDALGPGRCGVQAVWFNPTRQIREGDDPVRETADLVQFARWVLAAL